MAGSRGLYTCGFDPGSCVGTEGNMAGSRELSTGLPACACRPDTAATQPLGLDIDGLGGISILVAGVCVSVAGVSVVGISVAGVSVAGVSVAGVSVAGVGITGISLAGVCVGGIGIAGTYVPGAGTGGNCWVRAK